MDLKVAIKSYLSGEESLITILRTCGEAKLLAFGLVDNKELLKLYKERVEICSNCSIFLNGHCGDKETTEILKPDGSIYKGCGCLTVCIASRELSFCGAGKW